MKIFSKNKRAIFWARVISRVFDPIAVIPLLLVLSVWNALVNGERIAFLVFMLVIDVVLPGFVLYWFVQKKKISSGWDVTKRAERVPLFLFVVLAHLVVVGVAWFIGKHPMAEYLIVYWLLTVIFFVITLFWKISVHTGVISAFATFLTLTASPLYAWLYSLVLLVIWARVVGQYHRLSQAVAGALIPVILLPMFWEWIGLSGQW